MKDFNDCFFLVVSLTKETHLKIFHLKLGSSYVCFNIFHEYLTQEHYLMRIGSYAYKEGKLSL